jgi:predicted O-methyltransferase YrrM
VVWGSNLNGRLAIFPRWRESSRVGAARGPISRAYADARLARFSAGYLAALWGPEPAATQVALAMARAAVVGAFARSETPELSHLALYEEEDAAGPVQRDEALLLYSVIRVTRPKTLVELGFLRGHSAFNFLRAMDPDAQLYSFDVEPLAEQAAQVIFERDHRLHFRLKSQSEVSADDVDGRPVDFVFFDASHDLAINQKTFAQLESLLSARAIVAVHDTGVWTRDSLRDAPKSSAYARENPGYWLADGNFAHRPEERAFVNWIAETRPHFGQIHLHSESTLRHGVTLLQAGGPLPTT